MLTAGYHPTLQASFGMGMNLAMPAGTPAQGMMCLGWKALWEVLELPGGGAAFNCSVNNHW